MPSTLPTPLAAALGLVPATLDGVRSLPGRVVQLPILAVSSALTKLDATRRGYDDLAERGERLVARLRGVSFDELEDAVEDSLKSTPVAGLYDAVEDAAEDVVEGAGRALRAVTDTAAGAAQTVTGAVSEVAGQATGAAEAAATSVAETVAETVADAVPTEAEVARARAAAAVAAAEARVREAAAEVAEAAEEVEEAGGDASEAEKAAERALAAVKPGGKGRPTPKATEPDDTRIDSAAAPAAVAAADRVSGGPVLAHDELPLADYDHMTLGSLRGRVRSLSVEQLGQVRAYEKAHADRLPVVTMLDNRLAKLQTDSSVRPTGNTDAPTVPELQPSQIGQGGSKVQPATSGPTPGAPSPGVPTGPR